MKARTIYRCSLWVMSFAGLVNLVVVIWVFVKMRSPVAYNVRVVEPPMVSLPVMTNIVESSRAGLLPSRDNQQPVSANENFLPDDTSPVQWRHRYHYCVVAGRRVAFLNGVYVREGDRHAYGVVRDIYPERIYFEGGNYIDNITTSEGVVQNEPICK